MRYKRDEVEPRKIKAPSLVQKIEYLEKQIKTPIKDRKIERPNYPDWLKGV